MTAVDAVARCSVVRHGAPSRRGGSPWLQLVPFALVLAIFYFIILLPMKRKQQKVQEFLDALKVGDRVITTGGIYGQITKLGDQIVQLQIADKVRIEVAQGGDRRLPGPGPGRRSTRQRRQARMKQPSLETSSPSCGLRRHFRPSACIRSSRALRHPAPGWLMDKQLKLGLDLKGGVHLVLRVQTDDALRLETETTMERLREALRTAGVTATSLARRTPDARSRSKACRPTQDAAFRQAADRASARNFDRELRRQRHLHVHDEAEHRR